MMTEVLFQDMFQHPGDCTPKHPLESTSNKKRLNFLNKKTQATLHKGLNSTFVGRSGFNPKNLPPRSTPSESSTKTRRLSLRHRELQNFRSSAVSMTWPLLFVGSGNMDNPNLRWPWHETKIGWEMSWKSGLVSNVIKKGMKGIFLQLQVDIHLFFPCNHSKTSFFELFFDLRIPTAPCTWPKFLSSTREKWRFIPPNPFPLSLKTHIVYPWNCDPRISGFGPHLPSGVVHGPTLS